MGPWYTKLPPEGAGLTFFRPAGQEGSGGGREAGGRTGPRGGGVLSVALPRGGAAGQQNTRPRFTGPQRGG